uniref:Uncharacterized protein n=1 Tax=Rhizophora mucronata TaxID=61149 RepID=A0A2P2P1S4_RHIMU
MMQWAERGKKRTKHRKFCYDLNQEGKTMLFSLSFVFFRMTYKLNILNYPP